MAKKMTLKGKPPKGLNPTFGKKPAERKEGKVGDFFKTPSVTEADLKNAMKGSRKK